MQSELVGGVFDGERQVTLTHPSIPDKKFKPVKGSDLPVEFSRLAGQGSRTSGGGRQG